VNVNDLTVDIADTSVHVRSQILIVQVLVYGRIDCEQRVTYHWTFICLMIVHACIAVVTPRQMSIDGQEPHGWQRTVEVPPDVAL
jgi:hypothetical protein